MSKKTAATAIAAIAAAIAIPALIWAGLLGPLDFVSIVALGAAEAGLLLTAAYAGTAGAELPRSYEGDDDEPADLAEVLANLEIATLPYL